MKRLAHKVYAISARLLKPEQMAHVVRVGKRGYDELRSLRCRMNACRQRFQSNLPIKQWKWAFSEATCKKSIIQKWILSSSDTGQTLMSMSEKMVVKDDLLIALNDVSQPVTEGVNMVALRNVIAAGSDPFAYHQEDGVLVPYSYGVGRRMSERAPYNHSYFEGVKKQNRGQFSGVTLDMRSVSGDVFCHWLIEALPRLKYFEQCECGSVDEINIIASGQDLAFKRDSLVMAGVDSERVIWMQPEDYVECEKLITFTPMEIKTGSMRVTHALQNLLGNNVISHTFSKWHGKKVYVSRQNARFRKILPYTQVEERLIAHGYEVVYFENMTFAEQLDCVCNVSVLLGVHGSAHALIHVLPEGHDICVAEIFPPTYVNSLFCYWAAKKGLRYQAIVGNGKISVNAHDIGANVSLDVERFDTWLNGVA